MVIPVHDSNPTRRPGYVTYALIAINIVVFLISPIGLATLDGTTAAEACGIQRFFYEWAAIPTELTTNTPLDRAVGGPVRTSDGAVACALVQPDYTKIPVLSALTAMFLHGGWLHLIGNLLFLWVFGNNVEDRLGRLGYLIFYLACGFVATYAYAFAFAGSTTTLVGASGAIAGVLGAYLVMYPRAKVTSLVPFLFFIPIRLPAWIVLGGWFLLQWFYSTGSTMAEGAGVAYLAHVAGFVAGLLGALLFGRRRQPPPPPAPPRWRYRAY